MTWLFIRVYVGVLAVLFLSWLIHGNVWMHRSNAQTAHLTLAAHSGGARLVAEKVGAAPTAGRKAVLDSLGRFFAYPLRLIPLDEAPQQVRKGFASGRDTVYYRDDREHFVLSLLEDGSSCVQLGPFPNYELQEIESAIGGWMRLVARDVEATETNDRVAQVDSLRDQFEIPLQVVSMSELPDFIQMRMRRGTETVFFEQPPEGSENFYSAIPLRAANTESEFENRHAIRFGPFLSFERIEEKAATATLALVLLPAAFAIAIILRPVARQLRIVENAAKAIASGDLDARVKENRMRAMAPLANSFNLMADQTQSLLKSQRELMQAVSHELRTPLARIRFAADLIESAKSDQERAERLKAVDDATQQLDDLVGELLTYVRLESGAESAKAEPIQVNTLLSDVADATSNLFPQVAIHATNTAASDVMLPNRVAAIRALSNLTRNAARFASREVCLSAQRDGQDVLFTVVDDGPGIPEKDRQRIFQPFVRLEGQPDGGTGLGLALVKRIADRHGGRVGVTSSPTGGARFELVLPVCDPLLQGPKQTTTTDPCDSSQLTDMPSELEPTDAHKES